MAELVTLTMDTPSVQYLCRQCPRLSKVIELVGPISYSLHCGDTYSFLVHEIIEQMLSVKAAQKIYSRLEALCDGQITPLSVSKLTDNQIRSIGTANSKVSFIRSVTAASEQGLLETSHFERLSDDETLHELMSIRGIGSWTAKMFMIFVLDRQDVLPVEDAAFQQVFRWMFEKEEFNSKVMYSTCQRWKPYSSIAARFCYRALDLGLTKQCFTFEKKL